MIGDTRVTFATKRVAFVGQANYFQSVALSAPTTAIEPFLIEYRSGDDAAAMRSKLEQISPQLIIVFRPELVPSGTLTGLDAVRLGWFTEPIEIVEAEITDDATESRRDLARRYDIVAKCDSRQFDRLISYDPLLVPALEQIAPIWRSVPLPVDDRFFRGPVPIGDIPKVGFIGRSTPYREEFLSPLKHEFDLIHYAHGLFGDHLLDGLGRMDLAVNLHNLDIPNFENRVSLHLAQGHLLLSQPLTPSHGLEADRDFIEFRTPDELRLAISEIRNHPNSHELIRRRGRMKAEFFRASTVYEKIIRELAFEHSL